MGGGCQVEGVDEVLGRKWWAMHKDVGVQAQCMTWRFAYFDVLCIVHGGPRSQVPCSCRDAMDAGGAKATCRLPLDRLFSIMYTDPNQELPEHIMEQVFCRA